MLAFLHETQIISGIPEMKHTPDAYMTAIT